MKPYLPILILFSLLIISCTTQEKSPSDSEDSGQETQSNFYDKSVSSSLNYKPAPIKNRPEQIVVREAYTMSYNKDWVNCNWVYWRLTRNHCKGGSKRNNQKFVEDNEVKGYKATHQDYIQSGYDRGHMCPAGDNQWSNKAMSETFKLSNICPQNHNLNTGDWNDLEQACRFWANKYGDVYIVCGPIYYNNVQKRIGNGVGVPDAFFKCVVRMGEKPAGLGFVYKNVGRHNEMSYYVRTIDDVEREAKLNLFVGMPNEEQIEAKADLAQWEHFEPDYSKNRDKNKFDDSKSGGKKKKNAKKKQNNYRHQDYNNYRY